MGIGRRKDKSGGERRGKETDNMKGKLWLNPLFFLPYSSGVRVCLRFSVENKVIEKNIFLEEGNTKNGTKIPKRREIEEEKEIYKKRTGKNRIRPVIHLPRVKSPP